MHVLGEPLPRRDVPQNDASIGLPDGKPRSVWRERRSACEVPCRTMSQQLAFGRIPYLHMITTARDPGAVGGQRGLSCSRDGDRQPPRPAFPIPKSDLTLFGPAVDHSDDGVAVAEHAD